MLVDILNPHPEKGLIIEHQRIRNKVTKQDAIAVQNKPSKKLSLVLQEMICMYVLNLDDQYAQVARVKMHFGLA